MRWIAVVGPLCGALAVMTSTFFDIRATAKAANTKTTVSYETLAPAIQEVQDILADTQRRVTETAHSLEKLQDTRSQLEQRIVRLEVYMELLGRRQNLPAPPPEVAASKPDPEPAPDHASGVVSLTGESDVKEKVRKPERTIPKSIGAAQTYQSKRAKLSCKPEDPLCGVN